MYVYILSESFVEDGKRHELFTVGHYKPDGKFVSDSDHEYRENAACRVNYLNGGIADNIAFSIGRAMDIYYEYGIPSK